MSGNRMTPESGHILNLQNTSEAVNSFVCPEMTDRPYMCHWKESINASELVVCRIFIFVFGGLLFKEKLVRDVNCQTENLA